MRSERRRQRLLEEIVEDGADAQLASLAKALGRTVKAIAAMPRAVPQRLPASPRHALVEVDLT